jgi:hypothetical protein
MIVAAFDALAVLCPRLLSQPCLLAAACCLLPVTSVSRFVIAAFAGLAQNCFVLVS